MPIILQIIDRAEKVFFFTFPLKNFGRANQITSPIIIDNIILFK